MSLLKNILVGIQGWNNSVRYPQINAVAGDNYIYGTPASDYVVTGNISTSKQATLNIETGEGIDWVDVKGALQSYGDTTIDLGEYSSRVDIAAGMYAITGSNTINAGLGSDTITVSYKMESWGVNSIDAGDGNNFLSFGEVASRGPSGVNSVQAGVGNDTVRVLGNLVSEGENSINVGDGNNTLYFYRNVEANGGLNIIEAGLGSDSLTIGGSLIAQNQGSNEIYLGDGLNDFCLNGVLAAVGGTNVINSGNGPDEMIFNLGIQAQYGGLNYIDAGDGDNDVIVRRTVNADNAENEIVAGMGNDDMTFYGGLTAGYRGANTIDAGDGQNEITVINGLDAAGGVNSIFAGAGADQVCVNGFVKASGGGENLISTGDGNDVIQVIGQVGMGALTIDGGDGHDVLTLSANNSAWFNNNYQAWLTQYAFTDGLDSMGIEAIDVDLGSTAYLHQLSWLSTVTTGTDISVQLNLDNAGSRFNLGNLFMGRADDIFDTINLSGDYRNSLTIAGSLDRNYMSADELTVLGNVGDSVYLTRDWGATGRITDADSGHTFDVYTNYLSHEQLMLQAEISVITLNV